MNINFYIRKASGAIVGGMFVVSGQRRKKLLRYDQAGSILSLYSHHPTRRANLDVLKWLKDEGFLFMSTDELLGIRQSEISQSKRLAWLTFDDGWRSLQTEVIPDLVDMNIPATIFIAPDDKANKGPLFDENDVRKIAAECPLITFENHTLTHCKCEEIILLPDGPSRLESEIVTANKMIAEWTGRKPRMMCYPYGRYNNDVDDLVRSLGLIPVKTTSGVMTANTIGHVRNLFYNDMSFCENSCRVVGAWLKINTFVTI